MSTTALIAAAGYSRSGTGRGPGIELLRLSQDGESVVPTVERLAVVDLPDPSFVLWSRDGTGPSSTPCSRASPPAWSQCV
ncbi:hypothetical protein [Brachybacterium sp. Z12]|uniref:hypothetical protein n=1 Tax=Brachybacterium sp. Z12 TaxID=2759167 RepID=UPI00223B2D28|nr:hypothetical protein [Brachybacterium sp. Z12]